MNKSQCHACNGKARARTSWGDLQRKKEEALLKEMIEVNRVMEKLSKQSA